MFASIGLKRKSLSVQKALLKAPFPTLLLRALSVSQPAAVNCSSDSSTLLLAFRRGGGTSKIYLFYQRVLSMMAAV